MNTNSYLPIREFSLLTGMSKDSLRFYDKIGLLSPETRGKNSYRYYTERQTDMAFLIQDLRELGISLDEIKQYADERSPEKMLSFFGEQDKRIEAEIERLRTVQEWMHLRSNMAKQALQYVEDIAILEEKEEEPIFICKIPQNGQAVNDVLIMSYDYAAAYGVNISFPFGGIISKEQLAAAELVNPSQYYFKVQKKHNACKNAGTYAVLYRNLKEGFSHDFYKPLLTFIQEKGLHMEGDAYEEFILDELSSQEREHYKVRVEIRVVKK